MTPETVKSISSFVAIAGTIVMIVAMVPKMIKVKPLPMWHGYFWISLNGFQAAMNCWAYALGGEESCRLWMYAQLLLGTGLAVVWSYIYVIKVRTEQINRFNAHFLNRPR